MENNASTVGGERCACSIQVGVGERISSASSSVAILLQKLMASHLVDKPFILTSYRPRIGPEFQSELRYTAHDSGRSSREKQRSHTDLLKCFGGPKHQ